MLPLCLAGDALKWHIDLPDEVKIDMNASPRGWLAQLFTESKPDATTTHINALKLRFRFSTKDEQPLNTYLRWKQALVNDADITDITSVIFHG